jgi:phospholipid-binding lipoprotein MlaA
VVEIGAERGHTVRLRRACATTLEALMRVSSTVRAAALSGALLTAACASTAPGEGAVIADPYESFNRDVHSFNTGLDQVFWRPAAAGYRTLTPALTQELVSNFVDHVRLPVIFVNNVLQGDVEAAAATVGRFGVNTIVGAAGLLDPATEFGLPLEDTDFGITLARYGVGEGVFWMLPFFGPATSRDVGGRVGNFALNPVTYVSFGGGSAQDVALVGEIIAPPIVFRAENMELIDDLLHGSEDSYVRLRTSYVQNRRNQIRGGEVDVEALPDIFAD